MQLSPLLATIDAAQRAVTTALIAYSKVFDFSRLTLLKLKIDLDHINCNDPMALSTEVIPGEAQEAGQIYVVRVNGLSAKFEFEILDRKRGLRASLLHNLHSPADRAPIESRRKELKSQDLTEDNFGVLTLIGLLAPEGCTDVHGEFSFFGSLDQGLGTELIWSPQITEIVQSDVLIAQFKQNTVL